MKKPFILFIFAALVLTCCEPIDTIVARNEVQKLYDNFWEQLYADYVYFDGLDHESIYEEGLSMLEDVTMDSLMPVMNCTDTLVRRFQDPQLLIWSAGVASEYLVPNSEDYPPVLSRCQSNSSYSITELEHWNTCHFLSIQSLADGKNYLCFKPEGSAWIIESMEPFVDSCMLAARQMDYEGVIVDLRDNRRMQEMYMYSSIAHFLPDKDTTIFYTQQRADQKDLYAMTPREPYVFHGKGTFCDIPVCLLFEKTTTGIANNIAHILSGCCNVTTISMSSTFGGGALPKRVAIGPSEDRAFALAQIPSVLLSNGEVCFSEPLQPDIHIPYQKVKSWEVDPCVLKCLEVFNANHE